MQATSLAIVLNPRAAGGRLGRRRAQALRHIAGSRAALFVTEQRPLLDAVAQGVRERGARAVGIVGGDGTISGVLSALHRVYQREPLPPIALLRGGTMNTVANALQVPRASPERLLRRLLAVFDTSAALPTAERATLRVEGRLGFLFSAGVMAAFLERLYTERPGRMGAMSLLLRASAQAVRHGHVHAFDTRLDASLTVDDTPLGRGNYTALGAGTVPEIGLGFRPYPDLSDAAHFQVFAFTGDVRQLAAQLPRIRRGAPLREGLGHAPLARRLRIESHQGPLTYAIDGDLVRTGPEVHVTLGRRVHLVRLRPTSQSKVRT